MIKSVSYSRLLDFEACPYRVKLKNIDKIPEEQHPAAARGTQIHDSAETFVRDGQAELPLALEKFKAEFESLQERFKQGIVSLEGEWGFDKDWKPCGYAEAWLRMKLDARVRVDEQTALVIDYKTGRRDGNELKHGEQTVLYGLAEALREPAVERLTVELWYLDLDDIHSQSFTRKQILKYLPAFDRRLKKVTSATEFPPKPSVHNCKFCAFGPSKGKQCPYGIEAGQNQISNYRKRFG